MKKVNTLLMLIVISFILVGCGDNVTGDNVKENSSTDKETERISNTETDSSTEPDTSIEYVVEMKDVVFINRLRSPGYTDNNPKTNYLGVAYEFRDSQELLAFNVGKHYFDGSTKKEAIAVTEKMRELGLMVLADYPYSYNVFEEPEVHTGDELVTGYCVVVGTYEQLVDLFVNTEAIDGRLYHLRHAVRPDIVDYILPYSGKHLEGECDCYPVPCDLYDWYSRDRVSIEAELGEELYITLTVPVIMPEESTEKITEEQNEEITKEVVFYNKEYDKYRVGVLIKRNHMISLYEEELDSNKLYAFEISVECNRNGNMDYSEYYSSILKTLLQKEGLLIVKDYPSDNIVVAGTMEELKHIFEETDHLDGWCLRAEVAVRPDKEPTEGEETQVTLTVPVIMPEEETEN